MKHHADRLRRIKRLCVELDSALRESRDLQQHAKALKDEAKQLAADVARSNRRRSKPTTGDEAAG